MRKRFCYAAVLVFVGILIAILTSCSTGERTAAAPVPEAEQVVGGDLKELYMAASAAEPHSAAQQTLILRMARKASNGKELLLVMRAAQGVPDTEGRVSSLVTTKMIGLGTLEQLVDFATQYPVDPASARPYAERMMQLGAAKEDARVWYRIRVAAHHLKVGDLEQQAQARGDELASK